MRILVAGATGVIGRELLPQLAAAGHEVFGLARTPEKLLVVDKWGAKAIRGDVLNPDAMREAMNAARPQAIVNLATAIPLKLRVNLKDWELNDRVRLEGTRNLLQAAQATGSVRLFAQESVGYVCQSQGNGWIDEDAPLAPHPFLAATQAMEAEVRKSSLPATLLRFAALTSADSWHTQQSIAALRRGLLPIIGDGGAFVSLIHAEDAARAIVAALEKPDISAGQTFNVVDDAPAPMREILPYAAQLLHAPAPRQVAPLLAKMIVGSLTLDVLTASYRMNNERIKTALGWSPRYPTYRESWRQIASAIGDRDIAPSDDLK